MRKLNIVFILVFISSIIYAKENFGSIKVDEVTSIYDGDTFRANISTYPDIIGKRISIRINGIDTPEIKAKCIKEKELAIKAKQLTVTTLRNAKTIELRNMQRGKYFRIVADVYADNKSLANSLIENNLAVVYDGGTKTKYWCK